MTKHEISTWRFSVTIGFLYWLNETHNIRGLKNADGYGTKCIGEYPNKLQKLLIQYHNEYPNGLTGWTNNQIKNEQ